ncbi:MAG: sorbosone dehydrogenase family protein, partial [Candidatus Korobacteraceae bacterium]
MVNRAKYLALLTVLSLVSVAFADPSFKDSRFVTEQVISGLTAPVGFAFAPDGRMFVWEKAGRVRIVKDGKLLATPFLDIRDHVNRNTDRGLMGLALDPDFANNGYVYLAYVYENQGAPTSDQPRTQRITRVKVDPANPDRALPQETTILGKVTDPNCDASSDCSPNNRNVHTINRLKFGPDGKLYVGIGDGAHYGSVDGGPDLRRLRSQDLNSLNGKILRLNPDGTGPSDNPFYNGDANANRSKVY